MKTGNPGITVSARSLSPLMAMYTDADVAAALGERYLRQAASTALGALERLQRERRRDWVSDRNDVGSTAGMP